MSFSGLLKHRMSVRSLVETVKDGSSSYQWSERIKDVRCFVDLAPLTGVDPYYHPQSGRPTNRAGKLFVQPLRNGDSPVRSGDTIVVTKGPSGTFKVENIIDEIWTPHKRHHWEYGITEVAPQLARKQVSNPQ